MGCNTYKICLELTSSIGNIGYYETASFEVDKTNPNAATTLSWVEGRLMILILLMQVGVFQVLLM